MAMSATLYRSTLDLIGAAGLNLGDSALPLKVALYTADYDLSGGTYYENRGDSIDSGDPYFYNGVPLSGLSFYQDNTTEDSILAADDVTFPAVDGTPKYAVLFCDNDGSLDAPMLGHIDLDQNITYAQEPFTLSFPDGVLRLRGL